MSNDRQALAKTVKSFFAKHQSGVLSTISKSIAGYPFGSLTPYNLRTDGSFVIFISSLAEHFRNIQADSRCSILVAELGAWKNPQSGARATAVGQFQAAAEDAVEEIAKGYFARFPDAEPQKKMKDFSFFVMKPERIRWIGGFGDIQWLDGAPFIAAPLDEA